MGTAMIGLKEFSNPAPMTAINYLRTVTKTKIIGTTAALKKLIAIAIVGYG